MYELTYFAVHTSIDAMFCVANGEHADILARPCSSIGVCAGCARKVCTVFSRCLLEEQSGGMGRRFVKT